MTVALILNAADSNDRSATVADRRYKRSDGNARHPPLTSHQSLLTNPLPRALSFARVHHDLHPPIRALIFDRTVWRGAKLGRAVSVRFDLRRIDSHRSHQILLHTVRSPLT